MSATIRDVPAFDEVHVVSDLHLGGRAGFQGFREGGRLANYIERLACARPEGRLALVLNGDVFDTLAEEIPGWIAVDDACQTVERIVLDPAFAPVWHALSGFVHRPARTLVFAIGNHDLELALPSVQRLLLEVLAGDDPAARGRVEFSTVGGGFDCRVGTCRVFCTHGNEVDPWNRNRYDDLARLVRRLNAGRSMAPSEWRPNAGTRLVKEVMNGVKRRYAWIDLLKPETSAAIGALLVLDPAQATKLLPLTRLMMTTRHDGRLDAAHRLAAEVPQAGAGIAPAEDDEAGLRLLGPHLCAGLFPAAEPMVDNDDDDLLAVAEQRLVNQRGAEPRPGERRPVGLPPPPHPTGDRLLGARLPWRQRLQALAPSEALRLALLDWLADDKSFDPEAPDTTSRDICASVDADVDFIVAGHTHLERAIDRGAGRAYFNTGTWMRLLRLTPAVLGSRESFAPVWAVLADGSLQAIDAARLGSGEPLVMDRCSAVAIRLEPGAGSGAVGDGAGDLDDTPGAGGRVVAELLHVEGDGSGEPRSIRRFVRGAGHRAG